MDYIADRITEYLKEKDVVKDQETEIYRYGILTGIEFIVFLLISIGISVAMGLLLEGIIFFVIFFFLRSYTGGLHMEYYISCLVCSCTVFFGVLMLTKFGAIQSGIAVILVLILSVLIYKTSPVDHRNRLVDDEEAAFFLNQLKRTIILIISLTACLFVLRKNSLLSVAVYTLLAVWISMQAGKIKQRLKS